MKPNQQDIENWQELCESLEKVKRKATHWAKSGEVKQEWLLGQEFNMPKTRKWMKENNVELVFYSSGWGWRLRKDWKEKLEKLKEID